MFRQIKDIAITKTIAEDGDFLAMQNPITGETYNITKANLLAGLTSGVSSGGGTGGSSGITLAYASDGDTNGLFYYLGRQKNTVAWANPSDNGLIISSNSNINSGSLSQYCDRAGSYGYTNDIPGAYIAFHIGSGKLKCNRYSIQTRTSYSDYYPRGWKLQGSNDGATWVDLDVQDNNLSFNTTAQWLTLPVVTNDSYSDFRFIMTSANSSGSNYLCLGEVELYGVYTP